MRGTGEELQAAPDEASGEDGSPLARLERPDLGGLRATRLLGVGGQGLVWEAEGPEGPVAVKRPGHAGAEAQRRELAALRALPPHPGVVRLLRTVPTADGVEALVLERLPGESLAHALETAGPLAPERAAALGAALARALGHLHAHGLVHGDLKPGNVSLRPDGAPVLFDLGSAVALGAAAAGGTAAYMAPEQHPELAAQERVDGRTDVYLLGATLYEALTGCPPWTAADGARARRSHGQDPLERPADPRAQAALAVVPGDLRRILGRCLEGDPARRFPTAEAVAVELERWLAAPRRTVTLLVIGVAEPLAADDPSRATLEERLRRALVDGGGVVGAGDVHALRSTFPGPTAATLAALRLIHAEAAQELRAAIHVGEVLELPNDGAAPTLAGEGVDVALRLLRAAAPGALLLTTAAVTDARQHVPGDLLAPRALVWRAFGRYRFPGLGPDRREVVGGVGPEDAPPSPPVRKPGLLERAASEDDADLFEGPGGWRPSPGAALPDAPELRLERRLGSGAGGEVWLALHRIHGGPVAVKFSFDPAQVRQLRRERAIAQQLGRQGVFAARRDIARVERAHLEAPPFYVVSEYTRGGDLVAWCDARGGAGALPVAERLRLVEAAARALAAAHDAGVLHRDVKPTNLLLEADGALRLADFGIGRLVGDRGELAWLASATTSLTEVLTDGDAAGSRLYLAPEVLEGQPATTRSDVYSLGVVLYQLAGGDLRRAIGPGWERDLERALPDPDLAAVITDDVAACVARDPALRLGSAGALADRLRDADRRRAERVEARRLATRRRRARTGALALGAAAVVALAVLAGDRARLGELRRLGDVTVVERLEREARAGWPVRSSSVPLVDAWLARAEDLAARRPLHEDALTRLRALAGPGGAFAAADLQWEHDTLASLVERLERLASDDPLRPGSLGWARALRAESAAWAAAWAEAAPSMATVTSGLAAPPAPQTGLVPLRRDPATGLWEVWHPQSGLRPEAGPDGRWVVTERTGIVLVLVPGGHARLGHDDGFPEHLPDQVDLDPFFLARHEVTQAQWARLDGGADPSRHAPGREQLVSELTSSTTFLSTFPVEQVSWDDCRRVLGGVGLSLPTEGQWEWAARGPAMAAWPWGAAPPTAERARCFLRSSHEGAFPQPVGLRPAGASWCGVEDLAGNVAEWCLDLFIDRPDARPLGRGAGRRQLFPPHGEERCVRGGSWGHFAADCRPHLRGRRMPRVAEWSIGCRPARPVVPAGADGVAPAPPFDPDAQRVEPPRGTDGLPRAPTDLAAGFEGGGLPRDAGFEDGQGSDADVEPGVFRQRLDLKACSPWRLPAARFLAVGDVTTGWVLEARARCVEHEPSPEKNPYGAFVEARDERSGVTALFLPDEVRVFPYGGDDRKTALRVPGSGWRAVRIVVPAAPEAGSPRRALVEVDGAPAGELELHDAGATWDRPASGVRFGDGSRGAGATCLWDHVRLRRR